MADRSDNLASFLLGGLIGAVLGLLFAPCSGEETRRRLADFLDEEREKAKEYLSKDRLRGAWEAGKRAVREATGSEEGEA
jgi:gas vesicle protein